MAVPQDLQQAGFLATRGRGEGGGQLADVQLTDVQRDVSSRPHLQVGHPHGVVPWRRGQADQNKLSGGPVLPMIE